MKAPIVLKFYKKLSCISFQKPNRIERLQLKATAVNPINQRVVNLVVLKKKIEIKHDLLPLLFLVWTLSLRKKKNISLKDGFLPKGSPGASNIKQRVLRHLTIG